MILLHHEGMLFETAAMVVAGVVTVGNAVHYWIRKAIDRFRRK